jgi:hypothetical protein
MKLIKPVYLLPSSPPLITFEHCDLPAFRCAQGVSLRGSALSSTQDSCRPPVASARRDSAVQTTEDRGQTLEERESMEQMEEQLCQTLITVAGSVAESDANQREQQCPERGGRLETWWIGRKQGVTAPQAQSENT